MTEEKKMDVGAEIEAAYDRAREIAYSVFAHYEQEKLEYRVYVDELAWRIYWENVRREYRASCGNGFQGLLAALNGVKKSGAVAETCASTEGETGGDGLKNPPVEETKTID